MYNDICKFVHSRIYTYIYIYFFVYISIHHSTHFTLDCRDTLCTIFVKGLFVYYIMEHTQTHTKNAHTSVIGWFGGCLDYSENG